MRNAVTEITTDADRYDVIAANIYELLDEPQLLKNSDVKPNQAQFGILNAHGGFADASTAVQQFLRPF